MHHTIIDVPILKDLLQGLSIILLKIFGWRREGQLPSVEKYIIIGAPHTSNWDMPIGFAILFSYKFKFYWMGKDTLVRWPFRGLFIWLGGIPIDRSKSSNVVAQSIRTFKENAKMVMLITPEGTRKKITYWKTGFYYIASGANIPIVLGFLDYQRKAGGFGHVLYPTGDIEADMKKIRSFYANTVGKYPEKSGPATIIRKT
jgi:1-acyl-sn-glycerol-3-phosphate acyltransferase